MTCAEFQDTEADLTTMDILDLLLWVPSYDQCDYCSSRREPVPARYEAWLTLSGDMLDDGTGYIEAPHSILHTLCTECMARLRVTPEPDLTLVCARDIRDVAAA